MNHKKKKGVFSKVLIAVILIYMGILGLWAFRILSHTGTDASSILKIIYAFFGSELVMLLLKRIFAKEKTDNNVEIDEEDLS